MPEGLGLMEINWYLAFTFLLTVLGALILTQRSMVDLLAPAVRKRLLCGVIVFSRMGTQVGHFKAGSPVLRPYGAG